MGIPHEQIDQDAQKVIHRLVRNNHQAYLVGGCVRDLLLERRPKDFDIATSATPFEIKALFRNCRIIGRRFRLAHIFFGSKIIETATFRANPRVTDGDLADEGTAEPADDLLIRRDNVFGSAEEDARRRDFTINGLFYDLEADEVIDYVGGLDDLATRTVRSIGDAEIRFREDPVRILRAIKFAARLDFQIEPAAWRAILTHKGEIPKCAPPRVLEELYRLLRGGAARRSMELLRDTGVLALLIPTLAQRLTEGASSSTPATDPAVNWWWSGLDQLDSVYRAGGASPSNATLLCMLAAPFVGADLFADAEGRSHDVGQQIEDRTRIIFNEMRVSRRDAERTRQILLSQRRLTPSRRRRARPAALLRRDYFDEALEVYRLLAPIVMPGAASEEDLARWGRLAEAEPHTAIGPASDEVSAEGVDAPKKRRRRRRGGRRHSSSEADSKDAAPPPLAAGTE